MFFNATNQKPHRGHIANMPRGPVDGFQPANAQIDSTAAVMLADVKPSAEERGPETRHRGLHSERSTHWCRFRRRRQGRNPA
jgi:hypothetical protein